MTEDHALAQARAEFAALRDTIGNLDDPSLDLLFRVARTPNAFDETRDVPDELLRAAFDLARMGPTSANCQPMRIIFVRSAEGKAKLEPALWEGNRDKTMAAPVTAIIGYDTEFWRDSPRTFIRDLSASFESNPAAAEVTAFRNGTLGAAYFLIACRAVGLDCGGMSGFDNDAVDAAFFAGTSTKSNFLCNLGWGKPESIMGPRLYRYEFDEVCRYA